MKYSESCKEQAANLIAHILNKSLGLGKSSI